MIDERWSAGSSGAQVPDGVAAYGARWIDTGGRADIVWDRQGFRWDLNDTAGKDRLMTALVAADPARHVAGVDRDVTKVVFYSTGLNVAFRRSGGYVYVDAWMTEPEVER